MLILILEPGLGPKISTKGKTCLSSFKAWLKKNNNNNNKNSDVCLNKGFFRFALSTLFSGILKFLHVLCKLSKLGRHQSPEEERLVRPKRQVAFVVAVLLLMFNFIHSLCFFRVIVEADDQHTLSDLQASVAFETVGEDLNFSRPPAQPYHWKFGGGVRAFLKLLEISKKKFVISQKVAFCKKKTKTKQKLFLLLSLVYSVWCKNMQIKQHK